MKCTLMHAVHLPRGDGFLPRDGAILVEVRVLESGGRVPMVRQVSDASLVTDAGQLQLKVEPGVPAHLERLFGSHNSVTRFFDACYDEDD